MYTIETQTEDHIALPEEDIVMDDLIDLSEDEEELKGSTTDDSDSEDDWHAHCDELYDKFGDDDTIQNHGK